MELGLLLVVAASAAAGVAFRRVVGLPLGRTLLALGLGSLVLGLGVLGLAFAGGKNPFGFWTSGLVALLSLIATAVVLPFAVAVMWRRR